LGWEKTFIYLLTAFLAQTEKKSQRRNENLLTYAFCLENVLLLTYLRLFLAQTETYLLTRVSWPERRETYLLTRWVGEKLLFTGENLLTYVFFVWKKCYYLFTYGFSRANGNLLTYLGFLVGDTGNLLTYALGCGKTIIYKRKVTYLRFFVWKKLLLLTYLGFLVGDTGNLLTYALGCGKTVIYKRKVTYLRFFVWKKLLLLTYGGFRRRTKKQKKFLKKNSKNS
jgi:hypothetical protein